MLLRLPILLLAALSLHGEWRIAADPENRGTAERWFERGPVPGAQPCRVPGILEQNFPGYDGVVWYWKEFAAAPAAARQRALLVFHAADYRAEVWLNGARLGLHEGGETPFEFDVTGHLRASGNRLVVRLLNPGKQRVDGIVLDETPHGIKDAAMQVGNFWNPGGLWQDVELVMVPEVRVQDLFVQARLHDGAVTARAAIANASGKSARGRLRLTVTEDRTGRLVAETFQPVTIPVAGASVELKTAVADVHAWSPSDPYLYRAAVELELPSLRDRREVRTGFREFLFRDGYFRLNGRRIFVRGTHSVGHFPIGMHVPHDPELLRRELIYVKAMGFNMVRWLGRTMFPSQLALCDELGLMVYEESYASWRWNPSPQMAERFDSAVREMILRDRNHPSLVAWGLLNETADGPILRHATAMLPLVHSLDPTRMVLLNSGRWDKQTAIGSLANPSRAEWVPDLGGDLHNYPPRPWSADTLHAFRTMDAGGRNVFLSEYGNGSQIDPIEITRAMEQLGVRPDAEDYVLYKGMREELLRDWQRWGLDRVFASPSSMIAEGQRMQSEQRRIALNAIRSNPKMAGYSLTGLSDQAVEGEGLMTIFRELKPGIVDAMTDGFAPVRWCLFAEPVHLYRGETLKVEAVLANEDVLKPGVYPVRLRVAGAGGVLFEKTAELRIPVAGEGPMVFPAFLEDVRMNAPAGRYEVVVSMDGGASVLGRETVIVGDRQLLPKPHKAVVAVEQGDRLAGALTALGVEREPLHAGPQTILVGSGATAAELRQVVDAVSAGSTAIFLAPSVLFDGQKGRLDRLPIEPKLRLSDTAPRYWGRDDVVMPHPYFDGLPAAQLMDLLYYRDLIATHSLMGFPEGARNIVPAFAVGRPGGKGYSVGSNLLTVPLGRGTVVLSTLRLIENLGRHPAADRLLLNLIR